MRRSILTVFVTFLILVSFLIACAPAPVTPTPTVPTTSTPTPAAPEVIKWKGQSGWSKTVAPYGPFGVNQTGCWAYVKAWTDMLNYRTNGRLTIDWSEPGAIFPVAESDNAVQAKTVDISCGFSGYYTGRMPETDIENGGIFFWDDESQYFEALHKYGLFKKLQEVYAKRNIYWLPSESASYCGFGTTFPAPSPASMVGKKIRSTGVWGELVNIVGATPVSMVMGDVYMAAKLGTIDGTVGGISFLEELKLKEVLKGWVIYPNISVIASNILINLDSYNKLPKDIQAILQNESPVWTNSYSALWHNQNLWSMKNAQQAYGIVTYSWSEADYDTLRQRVVKDVFPKIAAKSPACAELMQIVTTQLKDYGKLK